MRIKNFIKLLAVLAILGSLVAIAAVPASAQGTISLSTGSGIVGASVTITATGWPALTVLTAKFDGAAMTTAPATVTTNSGGNVTFAVLIPTATAGGHKITVTDGVTTFPSPAVDNFTVLQMVVITSPTTKTGPVGTSVTVKGTGYSGAGVTVDVYIAFPKVLVAGVPVDNTGSFTATGTVPQLGSGDATVSATDGAGNAADVTDTFKVTPTMVFNPNSGLAGAKVGVSGSGWPTSNSVDIRFAGDSVVSGTVNTDANGQIVSGAQYTIPASATAGVKTVRGTRGSVEATTTFTVIGRQITLTPVSGAKGLKVLMTGTNMTPGGKILAANLLFNGAPWPGAPAEINIDSAGTIFPTTLVIPTGAVLGANPVQATDNGAPALIAYGAFNVVKPTIALNPTTGSINSSFTVTGAGWLPGTTAGSTVTITFNYTNTSGGAGTTSLTTIPDGSGNIAAAITVPADTKAGTATVEASDGKNTADTATFKVPGAAITVDPAQGPVGTPVTVTGSGFAAYTAITVKIGGYQFMSQPLTDLLGTFTYAMTIPGVAPGSQSITASDSMSTASAFFVVSASGATVQSQTASISSQLVRIWGYSNGTWYMYDPTDAAGSNLATLVSGQGYWINVNAACTLIYGGYSYALSPGWNLIGWR